MWVDLKTYLILDVVEINFEIEHWLRQWLYRAIYPAKPTLLPHKQSIQ